MKRSLTEEVTSSPTTSKQAKYNHDEKIGKYKNVFCPDVLSVIFSFIPVMDETLLSIKLVCHLWYDSLKGEFRHNLIHSITDYLQSQFELDDDRETMTRLLVLVKQWLGARQYTINLLQETGVEMDKCVQKLYKKKSFPNIQVLAYDSIEEYEDFVVLLVHLDADVYMKMTILYSTAEDCFTYVDVFGNYDWKTKLNIDPSIKRNTVFKMNPSDDMFITSYEMNREFFTSLCELLEITGISEKDLLFNILWGPRTEYRSVEGGDIPIKDVEFEKNVEISDERMNYLYERFNLKLLNEPEVIKMAWRNATKAFTSVMEKKLTSRETIPEILVSNVTGSFCSFDLTANPRRCVESTFDLLYKGHEFEVTFFLVQSFFYGHDSMDEPPRFECKSKTNGSIFEFMCYVDDSYLHFDEMPFHQMVPPDIPKTYHTFKEYKPDLLCIFSQWLELVPRYHLLSGSATLFIEDDNSLKFLIDHNNNRWHQGEVDRIEETKCDDEY
ncbi:Hypothetical protein NAEGRDRAFT_62574 [Naegleria gruberi]|uniref:F-box domain-containing protein n=1 Tax=Naegleria gruberi TaxID=5762 RepID=D2V1G8_NAEGR|nr:uncharacterized protein NAEGRDRAFT_62574 [Naegleria gruberi]EFC49163.1 Hypothetical protein NAEGRDRAFT_62574 [Naegleria gruberi]|eukprot:XP_002681907.1 Hypothetical protein NAEGRDRAFT_62574 [Naegleria gruberi strain NEG-M]